jgi:hypothetical protein
MGSKARLATCARAPALVVLCVSGCLGAEDPPAPTAAQAAAIQGGTTDATDTFSVGIVQAEDIANDMVSYCTGVMLLPNLIATARHCVAELSSPNIECSTSFFGGLYPASDLYVTTNTTINPRALDTSSYNNSVAQIIVPSGAGQDAVCGNDIALLILGTPIAGVKNVTPTINPPMTSSGYQATITAIGYGEDTANDSSTAGTRRIRENIALQCIPNDNENTALDCFAAPHADASDGPESVFTASEFLSGDSTCEGDSGSGAFEQSNFDAGRLVAFGVLSRGSSQGSTCTQPIYSRFDAWGPLLASTAMQAASLGGYAVPSWAMNLDAGSGSSGASGGASGSSSGASSGSGGSSGTGVLGGGDDAGSTTMSGVTGGAGVNGAICSAGTACASGLCASQSSSDDAVCVTACGDNGSCASNFACQGGYCFPVASSSGGGGCSLATAPGAPPELPAAGLACGIALVGVGLRRRRMRRTAKSPGIPRAFPSPS